MLHTHTHTHTYILMNLNFGKFIFQTSIDFSMRCKRIRGKEKVVGWFGAISSFSLYPIIHCLSGRGYSSSSSKCAKENIFRSQPACLPDQYRVKAASEREREKEPSKIDFRGDQSKLSIVCTFHIADLLTTNWLTKHRQDYSLHPRQQVGRIFF